MAYTVQENPTVNPFLFSTPVKRKQEEDAAQNIDRFALSSLFNPFTSWSSPEESKTSADIEELVQKVESKYPSTTPYVEELEECDKVVQNIAEKILRPANTLQEKLNISLPLIMINLYTSYRDTVYVPRTCALLDKAKQKEEEIKDLNLLTEKLAQAKPNKNGVIDLSEHQELIERIKEQEGSPIFAKETTWASKEDVKTQLDTLRGSVQRKSQEVSSLFTEISQEKESFMQSFETVRQSLEEHQKAMDRLSSRLIPR